MNFVWKTDDAEAGNIILLTLVFWRCFNCWWVRVEAVSTILDQLKSHISVPEYQSKIYANLAI